MTYDQRPGCKICGLPQNVRNTIDERIVGGSTLNDVVAFANEKYSLNLNQMNVSRHRGHSTSATVPAVSSQATPASKTIDISEIPRQELTELILDQIRELKAKKQLVPLTPDENRLLLDWTKQYLEL